MASVNAVTKKSTLTIIIAVSVLILAVAAYLFLKPQFKKQSNPAQESGLSGGMPTTEDLVEKLSPVTDPLGGGEVPDVNPVEKANPFKDIYKNPFE